MHDQNYDPYLQLITEAGIITQIATAFLERRLPDGVLASHFAVVNHLIRVRDGATPAELASAFQVPKTTMTHTLGGLERLGYIEMRPNPEDRRSKQVWLTGAGAAFRLETFEKMAPVLTAISARFSPEQAAGVLPDLSGFRAVIDQLRNDMD